MKTQHTRCVACLSTLPRFSLLVDLLGDASVEDGELGLESVSEWPPGEVGGEKVTGEMGDDSSREVEGLEGDRCLSFPCISVSVGKNGHNIQVILDCTEICI